jgi:hypothetical protein
MRGASVAIAAAVLAAAIGIDRLIEADVGTVVRRDDAAGLLQPDVRGERLELLQSLPSVIEALPPLHLETTARVASGAAATPERGIDGTGNSPPCDLDLNVPTVRHGVFLAVLVVLVVFRPTRLPTPNTNFGTLQEQKTNILASPQRARTGAFNVPTIDHGP